MRLPLKYNKRTLRVLVNTAFVIVLTLGFCFLVVISDEKPPRSVYPGGLFDGVIALAPATTAAQQVPRLVIQGRLDERFVLAWPKGLREGVLDSAIVRIASNNYENLLSGIDKSLNEVKQEKFKGVPRLDVTLTSDSGVEIIRQHSDEQVIVRGQPHKEWSWTILPKTTGPHRLILLVQGVNGNIHEDYDPEIKEYDVAFNWLYWAKNGIQQNGIGWIFTIVFSVISYFIGWYRARRKPHRK